MINTARKLLVRKQTLHARAGFMNFEQINTMARSDLVQHIRARGMRQITILGPFNGMPWLGLYGELLYEPGFTPKPPYTNETYNNEKRIEACNRLHSIEGDVGGHIECLAPFELALTPDFPPGSITPYWSISSGVVATTPTGVPTMMNNWGPCTSSDDTSEACKQFIKVHGRSYVYIMEANRSTGYRNPYLKYVLSKFLPLLKNGYSGAF